MLHRSVSSPRRHTARGPRNRQALTALSGTAVFLAAAAGLAPAASATPAPPEPSFAPVPPLPPAPAAPAHFPVWAIVAILAATVVLSVATTLVTLALKHFRPARRTLTAATGPQASTDTPSVTAEPEAGDGEILTSHDYLAERDIHPADSR